MKKLSILRIIFKPTFDYHYWISWYVGLPTPTNIGLVLTGRCWSIYIFLWAVVWAIRMSLGITIASIFITVFFPNKVKSLFFHALNSFSISNIFFSQFRVSHKAWLWPTCTPGHLIATFMLHAIPCIGPSAHIFEVICNIQSFSFIYKFKVKPATLLNSFNSLVTSKTSSVLRRNKIVSSAYCASLIRFILPFIDIDKPRSSCFICSARTSVAIINNKADIVFL